MKVMIYTLDKNHEENQYPIHTIQNPNRIVIEIGTDTFSILEIENCIGELTIHCHNKDLLLKIANSTTIDISGQDN